MATTKIYHPTVHAVSWRGTSFRPDTDGAFEVPAEAVADLLDHGFSRAKPCPAPRLVPAADFDAMVAERDALARRVAELEASAAAIEAQKERIRELEGEEPSARRGRRG